MPRAGFFDVSFVVLSSLAIVFAFVAYAKDPSLPAVGARNGLALLWFSTGKEDFLLNNTKSTVEMLKKHGFTAVFNETPGAHTWINWRNYLNEFAPQLFR